MSLENESDSTVGGNEESAGPVDSSGNIEGESIPPQEPIVYPWDEQEKDSRRSSRKVGEILRVAGICCLALVVGGAVGYGVWALMGMSNSASATLTTTSTRPSVPTESPSPSQEPVVEPSAESSVSADMPSDSTVSSIPVGPSMPIWSGASGIVFVAGDNLSDTAGEAMVYRFAVDPSTVEGKAKVVAEQLGFGTPRFDSSNGYQWSIQENAGTPTERYLNISGAGVGSFSFYSGSAYFNDCATPYSEEGENPSLGAPMPMPAVPAAPPVASGSGGGGSAGSTEGADSSGSGVSYPVTCLPDDIREPYGPEEAISAAKKFVSPLYPVEDMAWVVENQGAATAVTAYALANGSRVGLTFFLLYDPSGEILSAAGFLSDMEEAGTYPTVSQRDTVERSNSSEWGQFIVPLYMTYPVSAGSMEMSEGTGTMGPSDSLMGSGDSSGVSPSASSTVSSDTLVTLPVTTMYVEEMVESYSPLYQLDGSLLVVPSWEMIVADGMPTWQLISLDESTVTFTSAPNYGGPPVAYAR